MGNKKVKKSSQKSYQRIKSERISFRLTEKEKELLKEKMSILVFTNKSDFVKFCIFGKEHTATKSIHEIKKLWDQIDIFFIQSEIRNFLLHTREYTHR